MTQAQATTKEEAPQRVIYFGVHDALESAVCQAWAKKRGKVLVTEIPMSRITPGMVFVPVVRQAETRTPLLYEEFSAFEQKMHRRQRKADDEQIQAEVIECAPVRVSDFWRTHGRTASRDPFTVAVLAGDLDENGFINALNESTREYSVFPRTHHGDENRTLRLSWGA